MSDPIEFYFDFSSPYAYFAAFKIDELAEGFSRDVTWKPTLLGVIMKTTGNTPLTNQPVKRDYCTKEKNRGSVGTSGNCWYRICWSPYDDCVS